MNETFHTRLPETTNVAKYMSRNPVVRTCMSRYFRTLVGLLDEVSARRILDAGCGEGLTARRITAERLVEDYLGIDVNAKAIEYARYIVPSARFVRGDLLSVELGQGLADTVICLEVMEHMRGPHQILDRFRSWSSNAVIVSVPWEPYFRVGNLLRFKYLRNLGNHPEHVQHYNPVRLRSQLSEFFERVSVRQSFPWLFGLCFK